MTANEYYRMETQRVKALAILEKRKKRRSVPK